MLQNRGLDFPEIGMTVQMGHSGVKGKIVGMNHCCNLDVKTEDGKKQNWHPTWDICYFDNNGVIIKDYRNKQ